MSRTVRLLSVAVLATAALTVGPPALGNSDGPSPDFDGDGYADLAAGNPHDHVGPLKSAGSVTILYGTPTGLSADGNQLWTLDTPGVPGSSQEGGFFGFSPAWGDVNGDGFDDLAIGAPSADVGSTLEAGSVTVLYGSATGLSVDGAAMFNRATPGVPGERVAGEGFGRSVTTGDLDGDGFDDLVIGVPQAAPAWAGAIVVLPGSTGGLTTQGAAEWNPYTPGIGGSAGAEFGWQVTTGDFNGDGFADIASGSPHADGKDVGASGAVWTIPGSASGPNAVGSQLITEEDIAGVDADPDDGFGWDLGVGDFNGDGFEELAVASTFGDVNGISGAGWVVVLDGSPTGVDPSASAIWHQDRELVPETAESSDKPWAVAVGDYDGDGLADLAIGFWSESWSRVEDGGAVIVLYGSAGGLVGAGSQLWTQDSADVPGVAEHDDWFGDAVAAMDVDGDGDDDLAVGASGEDHFATDDGAVIVLSGTSHGLTGAASQLWSHATPGVHGTSDTGDRFGDVMGGR